MSDESAAQAGEMNAEHLAADTLEEYVAMTLPDHQALRAEEHLAGCAACARLTYELETRWREVEEWTARSHGAAYLRAIAQQAVERARTAATQPAARARLARWVERWGGRAEAALRVVLEAPGRAPRIVTEGLESLVRPGATWRFAPVAAGTPIRGPLDEAAPPRPSARVESVGGPPARVAAHGHRREIVVQVAAPDPGRPGPQVLLVPLGGQGEPRLATAAAEAGADYAVVRFDQVAAGEYLVLFEPRGEGES